ncbi:GrpB family protein [Plastoroseomonas hellenica]|uniref:GrpB family protein n=1 Tax=Plastoroseomonas hellenica TaxID=2687306 RepID=UPI001FE30E27|nr:GrpB family protein [Plastoroseomonas hellenica]
MVDEVWIADYDPRWPAMYAAEAARLRAALPPGLVLAMEHFGSTAIPGMAAKPVIDILVAVPTIEDARRLAVGPMEALGYAFWADNPRRDRLFFVKGLPPAAPHRTHHVHMTETSGEMWQRLLFRDYLRAHPDEAANYAALKRQLAVRHGADREAYTAEKTAFVDAILERASQRTK